MGKSASKLSDGSVNYKELEASTPYTAKQLKYLYREFRKDCPSGDMDKQTFIKKFGSQFSPAETDVIKLADYVFKRFDVNQDGKITFTEFITAVSIPTKGSVDEKLDWAFSIYDINDDGFVTPEEMLNVIKAILQRRGLSPEKANLARQKVVEIFERMDENNDGKLSKEEFIYGFKNDPLILNALIDTESDGDTNINLETSSKKDKHKMSKKRNGEIN